MNKERLSQQIGFILEIDRLKTILRQSLLISSDRKENDAEHSWHLAVMAILLSEYSNVKDINICKVIKMVLIHDLVEIDAGDTYCYDPEGVKEQADKERRAANRIFGMLPPDQEKQFHLLWEEFETMETPEAKFAASLDRLQPLLHNFHTNGTMWMKNGITKSQVLTRNNPTNLGSEVLWDYAKEHLIDAAVRIGYLIDE